MASSGLKRATKMIMKSHRLRIPKYEMPVRLRPWFLAFTAGILLTLAFLGFTNFSRALPLNDKLLHFLCFCLATAVFYFIFDVEEDARRIWFWRHSGLIFTAIACFFVGGIFSEFVQSMLPYKEFQFGDVVANLLGSTLGLYIAYHLERYYRRRREIARLYRPLEDDYSQSDSDGEDNSGVQLLPTHTSPVSAAFKPVSTGQGQGIRLGDVWDEREGLFGIGDDSDDENEVKPSQTPKIVVTTS